MKTLVVAALLLSVPAFAADSTTAPLRAAREFVANNSSKDWWLGGGWSWNDGTLTHWSGSGEATAQQIKMPALTAGRSYGIYFTHSGSTTGSVTFSMGNDRSPAYSWGGTFPFTLTVTDPDALLTIIPTSDYDGSISNIRVVELGDELVSGETLTVSRKSEDASPAASSPTKLTAAMPIVPRRIYRLYFGVSESPDIPDDAKRGAATLGGRQYGFTHGTNYRFDVPALDDAPLVFELEGDWFEGLVSRISVREILSDPVSPGAEQSETAGSGSR